MVSATVGGAGMRTRISLPAALALGLAISLAAPSAQAAGIDDFSRGMKGFAEDAFDLAVLRPAGVVAMLVGAVFFVASVPAVAPYHAFQGSTEGIRSSYDVFVYPPYEYTILRDIGDF
jgi:hypothetical protein